MLGSARFEPSEIEISPGDSVAFVLVSGAPHNVAFDSTALSPASRAPLRVAVHDAIMPFAGPLLLKEGERYVMSFAGVPAGRYPFFCMPHVSVSMRGVVVVR